MYTGVNIPTKLWQCKMYCNNCTAQCTICCTANLDRVRVQTHKQIYATTHVGHVRFELGPLRYNYRLDRMNKTGISRTDKSSSYNLTQGVLQNIIPLCLMRTSSYLECFIYYLQPVDIMQAGCGEWISHSIHQWDFSSTPPAPQYFDRTLSHYQCHNWEDNNTVLYVCMAILDIGSWNIGLKHFSCNAFFGIDRLILMRVHFSSTE